MAKRWSQKAKKDLIVAATHEAIRVLKLQDHQFEVVFDNDAEYRATCEYQPEYLLVKLTFAPKRIRIWECVEFACHEPAHVKTWKVAGMLERAAGDDPERMKDAEDAYEEVTTTLGHAIYPAVVKALEESGKLPVEAREIPTVVVFDKRPLRKLLDPKHIEPDLDTAKHP